MVTSLLGTDRKPEATARNCSSQRHLPLLGEAPPAQTMAMLLEAARRLTACVGAIA